MTSPKRVVVIGIGYVGFPLAIMLARTGHEVIGVDKDKGVVSTINNGLSISEGELEGILAEPQVRENFRAQGGPTEADVFVISVPTPLDERKRVADLADVKDALSSILPYLKPGNLVILESTIPPLTCRNLVAPIIEATGLRVGTDIFLAHCPERILPGNVFAEIVNSDRIIGGMNPPSAKMASELYASFVQGNIYQCDDVTAELVKLMENTYRDVNIALANEFAAVAENLDVDVGRAIRLANNHPRVDILWPGIGTGGHCIPIDPWFIKEVDPVNTRLIHTARSINDEIPPTIAAKIRRELRGIENPKIVAIGLSYKPNTYDVRNSPAVRIVEILESEGYDVRTYDPLIVGREYASLADVAKGADCLVILVEHDMVKKELESGQEEILKEMATPILIRFYS